MCKHCQVERNDLRKELRIAFDGEEGIDEGGVKKEWFSLLVREIFDPKYGARAAARRATLRRAPSGSAAPTTGMFLFNASSRSYWFRRESSEIMYYNLMGTLLGCDCSCCCALRRDA